VPPGGQRGRMLAAARRRKQPWWRREAVSARWRSAGRRARLITVTGAAVVVAAAVALVAVIGSSAPPPRARQYLAFTACLLTGSQGLSAAGAGPAWAGLQQASLATRAKVQYLPVMTGTTAAAAAPYLASLTTRHCSVIVAVGAPQVAAVAAAARRYPSVRFAVVGGGAAGRNVTAITGGAAQVKSVIDGLVTTAVAHSTSA
jgi:basic membrane lipoprotein Med (substrate-binding protein (PBP1-ABC) superfamily)